MYPLANFWKILIKLPWPPARIWHIPQPWIFYFRFFTSDGSPCRWGAHSGTGRSDSFAGRCSRPDIPTNPECRWLKLRTVPGWRFCQRIRKVLERRSTNLQTASYRRTLNLTSRNSKKNYFKSIFMIITCQKTTK